ncbi:MAG: hypothetical protein QOH25_3959 [Acidobacteriota bacterium]|jgi:glycosyltransferase involved in cell wall biosynthesis|nr:hypothetical protein [Acidobacteriota bacterium]
MTTRTLYLCYFGLREPLVQTQVLPYLRQIRAGGVHVSLLTFEPNKRRAWSLEETDRWRKRLEADGIQWFSLPYHKRPTLPATLFDIVAGTLMAARLVRRHKIDVLHARAHIAAAIGAMTKRLSGAQLIFDIRGLIPEEYVDAGVWPKGGYLYRLTKAAERRLFAAADGFVVLTEKACRTLFPGNSNTDYRGRPIEVIPCCVDLERFRSTDVISREELRRKFNLTGRRVIVYVGALGGWYLTQEMADFLAVAHEQDKTTFSMILTQSAPQMIAQRLNALGIAEENYLVREVLPEEIPRYLKAADIAISFIKPCYSKLASSPTKIAEYLASGLPVICNAGIGDLDEMIEEDRVGVIIRELNREGYLQALGEIESLRLDNNAPDRCRASARNRFDLGTVGGERYRRLYQRLFKKEKVKSASDLVAAP